VQKLAFSKNEQKEPWFTEINPNGRIPAISDTFTDGKPIHVFESGGILTYLVDRYDKDYKLSYPKGTREYYDMVNWVFFQNAGVGPMQGQANHFFRYAPEPIQYGIDRYQNESRRLYGVLDEHLKKSKSGFIVGDHISIADVTHFGWAAWAGYAGVNTDGFEHLAKWLKMMAERPAVHRGRNVPDGDAILNSSVEDLAKRANEHKKWIQDGMKKDAEK
jgi:glutathione S-transferase